MKREELRTRIITYCDYCGKELHTPYTTVKYNDGRELDFCSDYAEGEKNCRQKFDEDGKTITLPPAEGAEETTAMEFVKREGLYSTLLVGSRTNPIYLEDLLTRFATLHAQQMAEKMVEDMRRKLFSMRATKKTMDMLSEADRLITYGYHDCINEMLIWTKNKER